MKIGYWLLALACAILQTPFSILAQPATLNDPAMFNHAPASSAAPFNPSQVTGAALFLSYLDMPTNATLYNWTNEIAPGQVFTNKGTTYPTNSGSGVYFPGTAGDYFLASSNNLVPTTNSVHSIWICFKPIAANGTYDCLLGYAQSAGRGIYLRHSFNYLYDGGSSLITGALSPLTSQYDVALPAGSPVNVYINGVTTNTFSPSNLSTKWTMWGIGQDADGNTDYNGCIKFVLVCTNYTFTSTDIANLHTYATGH